MSHKEILEALVVTAELTGTQLSPAAQAVMVKDLMCYPADAVARALTRCRKELTGRLTLAAILERIDDGRPGADEAWGMIAHALADENETVVWTEEMAQASSAASELMALGDKVAARMAFRDAYERQVANARLEKHPAKWTVCPGHDPVRRASAIMRAVEQGRLPSATAAKMLPYQSTDERHLLLTGKVMTPEERRIGQQNVRHLLTVLADKMHKDDAA